MSESHNDTNNIFITEKTTIVEDTIGRWRINIAKIPFKIFCSDAHSVNKNFRIVVSTFLPPWKFSNKIRVSRHFEIPPPHFSLFSWFTRLEAPTRWLDVSKSLTDSTRESDHVFPLSACLLRFIRSSRFLHLISQFVRMFIRWCHRVERQIPSWVGRFSSDFLSFAKLFSRFLGIRGLSMLSKGFSTQWNSKSEKKKTSRLDAIFNLLMLRMRRMSSHVIHYPDQRHTISQNFLTFTFTAWTGK